MGSCPGPGCQALKATAAIVPLPAAAAGPARGEATWLRDFEGWREALGAGLAAKLVVPVCWLHLIGAGLFNLPNHGLGFQLQDVSTLFMPSQALARSPHEARPWIAIRGLSLEHQAGRSCLRDFRRILESEGVTSWLTWRVSWNLMFMALANWPRDRTFWTPGTAVFVWHLGGAGTTHADACNQLFEAPFQDIRDTLTAFRRSSCCKQDHCPEVTCP